MRNRKPNKPPALTFARGAYLSMCVLCGVLVNSSCSPGGGTDAPWTADSVYRAVADAALPNGLVETSRGSGLVSLYDNALAAILFTSRGETDRAEAVFDYFRARLDSELRSGSGGFYQFRDSAGSAREDSARWLGDNAWLAIALNHYRKATGKADYDLLAGALYDWIRSLQEADGGLNGGTRGGVRIAQVTEGMVDAFNAVPGFDQFHERLLDFLDTSAWDGSAGLLIAGPEVPDPVYRYALDLSSWGYCALECLPPSVLSAAELFRVTVAAAATGKPVTGYCFDADRDTVWYEGTGQMAVAFRAAGNAPAAEAILREMEKGMIVEGDGSVAGLPYAAVMGTGFGAGTLWEGADSDIAAVASMWYLFAAWGIDPMEAGRGKAIPSGDRFPR